MSQFSTPTPRRSAGDLDVYTGILCAAFLVLAAGVFLLATKNTQHSSTGPGNNDGGMFNLIGKNK